MFTIRSGQIDFTFCENEVERSICQNVALIISTRKGSVPLYRDFGINMDFLDRPMPAAEALLFAEVSEAIDIFEPRARLVDLTIEDNNDGHAVVVACVRLRSEDEQEY